MRSAASSSWLVQLNDPSQTARDPEDLVLGNKVSQRGTDSEHSGSLAIRASPWVVAADEPPAAQNHFHILAAGRKEPLCVARESNLAMREIVGGHALASSPVADGLRDPVPDDPRQLLIDPLGFCGSRIRTREEKRRDSFEGWARTGLDCIR